MEERRIDLPNGWYLLVVDSTVAESPCRLMDANDTELMSGAMMHPDMFAADMLGKN